MIDCKRPTIWKKVKGKTNNWYIPVDVENKADFIHIHDPKVDPFRKYAGYGGSTLEFKLEDGSVDKVKGPWHSNSEALYEDTGIDIRDKHYTMVTVCEKSGGFINAGGEVYYKEDSPVLGTFERLEIIKEWQEKLDKPFYLIKESYSGSSAGMYKCKTCGE